jgi:outer membrane protein TolC
MHGLRRVATGAVLVWLSSAWPSGAQNQPAQVPLGATVELSLDDAVRRAVGQSEEVGLARAAIESADTRIAAARASGLPQLSVTAAYVRRLQSPITRGLEFRISDADRFSPDPTASIEERIRYLEQNSSNAVLTTLADLLSTSLQNVGFGSPHTYSANLAGSQLLYSGGRVGAAVGIARHQRDAARANYREEAADVELNVRTAYYRALLAAELESIAQAAVVQAESFLNQERLRRDAGFASDLDLLRAEVSLENLRPQLVESRNALELATLDLKRLVNVPLAAPVRLTTPLEIPTATITQSPLSTETLVALRPAVQAAAEQVAAAQQNVRLNRAAYLPTLSLQVAYGGQVFPQTVFGFGGATWQPNSSATVALQLPIFAFQRGADVAQAQVQVRQAQLQSLQLAESVQLQYQQALGERERARATIAARQRTVDQAQRVYDLTVLRYGQGQATQLEISDARLALLQARSNLAQALADFYIATAAVTRAVGATTVEPPAAPVPSGPAR